MLDKSCYGNFAHPTDGRIASSIKQTCLLEKQDFPVMLSVTAHRWACFQVLMGPSQTKVPQLLCAMSLRWSMVHGTKWEFSSTKPPD
jgi:hypothetical protein